MAVTNPPWTNYSGLPLNSVEAKLLDHILFYVKQTWLCSPCAANVLLNENGDPILDENGNLIYSEAET